MNPYHAEIRRRIRDRLSVGCATFTEIVRGCEGAYPTLVKHCLDDLEHMVHVNKGELYQLQSATDRTNRWMRPSVLNDLEDNPVLSAWHFSTETCRKIRKLRDWSDERLVFLGTPRLYEEFARLGCGRQRTLLDLDSRVVCGLQAIEGAEDELCVYDTRDTLPARLEGRFDTVFFDPPWYPRHYLLWLRRAAELTENGDVVFSLFPRLTRPGAGQEREAILRLSSEHSEEKWMVAGVNEYEIPTFERGQLENEGVDVTGPWKLGDLVVLLGLGRGISEDTGTPQIDLGQWAEVELGQMRVFVQENGGRAGNGRLLDTVEEGRLRLRSPSRRNPEIQRVNVLTSRGHGLHTSDPTRLLRMLREIAASWQSKAERRKTIAAMDCDESSQRILRRLTTDA